MLAQTLCQDVGLRKVIRNYFITSAIGLPAADPGLQAARR